MQVSNTKPSPSPIKGHISLDSNLKEMDKDKKQEQAGLTMAKLEIKKLNNNPGSTYFESLSPIRNKKSSPLLKNLTIEEESHQNNESAYQSSDVKK